MLEQKVARIRSWNKQRLRKLRADRDARTSDHRDPLCVMAIVKNEALNIVEWADHYFWQGASHLFIIDNGCTDSTVPLLQAHPRSQDITIFHLPRPHRQAEHYRHVFKVAKLRTRFQWLLVADADEFWFSPSGRRLPEVLHALRNYDLIYCNWTNFGSSGHRSHPSSLRKELTQCAPSLESHDLSKWVVRTDAIRWTTQIRVHKVSGCRSTHTISENEQLRINHYTTQSLHYWTTVKMTRGDAFDPAMERFRDLSKFEDLERRFTTTDDTLARQVAAL
jgi:hypothetical protein